MHTPGNEPPQAHSRSVLKQFLFTAQIEEELWEEEFIERCFQEMLEEEEEHEWFIPARDLPQTMDQIQDQFNDLVISDSSSLEDLVVSSASPSVSKAQVFVQGWGLLLLMAGESPSSRKEPAKPCLAVQSRWEGGVSMGCDLFGGFLHSHVEPFPWHSSRSGWDVMKEGL